MTNWCLSLPGDPAWWQAFAGVAQAILAVALFYVTHKYVKLTAELVRLQADVATMQKQAERRELYDRRVKVYDVLMSFLALFARDMKIELQAIIQLYRDTREAEFLFGSEIPEFIKLAATAAHEHRSLRPDAAIAAGDVKKMERINEVENWLAGKALEEAKEKFGRYLRLAADDGVSAAIAGDQA